MFGARKGKKTISNTNGDGVRNKADLRSTLFPDDGDLLTELESGIIDGQSTSRLLITRILVEL